jgi:hypothetical protein
MISYLNKDSSDPSLPMNRRVCEPEPQRMDVATAAIAGRSLAEWWELSKRDDCYRHLVPSDLRCLVQALTSSEKRAETARDDALEEAARVAAAHDADQGIKKLGPSNFRMASEEARMAMRDEARGERIASEMIAKAIRAMKEQR